MMSDSSAGDQAASLANVICDWVIADDTLSEDVKVAVLSAMESDESLFTALNGALSPARPLEQAPEGDTANEPAGAFLKSITVRGFRGVGPQVTLAIRPAPGLTIVAGRNGSGKSSFADALELALTGDTYRWRNKKSKVWSEHWRNVHDGTSCCIRIELAREGVGVTTVGVDWTDGASLTERATWVQRAGETREPGRNSLGWDRAIELYQPILSYDEVGRVLDQGPSKLFDKIDAILGIEQATDAEKRLVSALKQLQETDKDAKLRVRDLKKSLATLSDERALQALAHLRKRTPDLDAVEAIATGTVRKPVEVVVQLKALTQVMAPSRADIAAVAERLRGAAGAFAAIDSAVVEMAGRRAQLLRQALTFHQQHGDGPCPVCGQGELNAVWRANAEAAVGADDDIGRYGRLAQDLASARDAARSLVKSVWLPVRPERIALDSYTDASVACQAWLDAPGQDDQLAIHLESVHHELEAALELLRQEAEAVLLQHEDEWAPHAISLAAWVGTARKAKETEPKVRIVEAAHRFMKAAVDRLRDQELATLTGTAREIWAALKQESNVNLGAIELKGTSTRRHVELRADVDGAEAQALGVMSQGELHALAMALFLPRATMPGSPFRFVVLDDPIQAMDPAKVDGFVRVLAQLATERQVVVFSHDDRLAQVVRQSQVEAEILEVCRHPNSSIEICTLLDPAARYIEDAFAFANDRSVPRDIAARIIPGLCRMAVEAVALDVYRTRRFTAGDRPTDVDTTWQDAKKTRQRVALAVLGDRSADLTVWTDQRPFRQSALQVVVNDVHTGLQRNPVDAIRDVERLMNDIREATGAR